MPKKVDNDRLEYLILADRAGEDVRDELMALLDRTVQMTYAARHHSLCGEGDDLKQEGFTKVLQCLDLWTPERGKAWTFLSVMALNRMRDCSRANRRQRRASGELLAQAERDETVRRFFMRR